MSEKINNLDKSRSDFLFYSLCVIMIFLIMYLSLKNLLNLNQPFILDDEFAYLSIPAYLAGHDWLDLTSSLAFYSYGYGIILTPLFLLNLDAEIIYKVAIILNAILLITSFILAYNCGRIIFPTINKSAVLVAAFATVVYSNNLYQVQIAWAESISYFIFWLLVWLFIWMIEKPAYYKIILLSAICIYAYLIHQRSLGIILSLIISFFCYEVYKSKDKKEIFIFVFSLIFFFIIGYIGKEFFIKNIWENSETASGNDYSGIINSNLAKTFNINGLKEFIGGIIGRIYYIGAATFFIAYIGIRYMFSKCLILFRGIITRKERGEAINVISAFCIMSVVFSMVIGVLFMLKPTRLDIVVYGRYFENSIGPLLLFGFLEIYKNKKVSKELIVYGFIFILATFYVQGKFDGMGTLLFNSACSVGLSKYFTEINSVQYICFYISVCTILVFGIFACLIYLKCGANRYKVRWMIAVSLIAVIWIYDGSTLAKKHADISNLTYETYSVDIVEFIRKEEDDISIYFMSNDEESNPYILMIKNVQFLLYDKKVHWINGNEMIFPEAEQGDIFIIQTGSVLEEVLVKRCNVVKSNEAFTLFEY